MTICAVYGCFNWTKKTKGTNIKYFTFPKDEHLCKLWVNACRRNDKFNINTCKYSILTIIFSIIHLIH